MVDDERCVIFLAGFDYSVGVFHGCGQGLLDENTFHSSVGGVNGDIGVQVVRSGHCQNVQPPLGEHFLVVRVHCSRRPAAAPVPVKLFEQIRHQVADAGHLKVRHLSQRAGV